MCKKNKKNPKIKKDMYFRAFPKKPKATLTAIFHYIFYYFFYVLSNLKNF